MPQDSESNRARERRSARHYDLVIVGAGIAGSSLALALADSDLRIALIEARPLDWRELPAATGVTDFDGRVSALTPQSQAFLESLRAWPGMVRERVCPYREMRVWDAEGTGEIHFDCAELGAPVLGHIVENRVITRALLEEVQACAEVDILSPAVVDHYDPGTGEVTLEGGRNLSCDLLVAADGALSPIRSRLGFETREWDYGHRAIIATVAVEHSHRDTAWQRFLPSGPLALLPLTGGGGDNLCSLVWSVEEELADDILALDDAAFCTRLSAAAERCLGTVLAASPRVGFPLRQRHAVDYVQSGVALVGDAAHTIHPLAGQGINLGLKDVAVLAEELVTARDRGQPLGDLTTLQRYQRRRKGDNLLMMGTMEGFKRLFAERSPALRWLRNTGMREIGRISWLKQQLMRRAMGLDNSA